MKLSTRLWLGMLCIAAAASLGTWAGLQYTAAVSNTAPPYALLAALAQHELDEQLVPITNKDFSAAAIAKAERQVRLLAWITPAGETLVLRRRSALDLERLITKEDIEQHAPLTRTVFHSATPQQHYQLLIQPQDDKGALAAIIDLPPEAATNLTVILAIGLSLGLLGVAVTLTLGLVSRPASAIAELLTDLDAGVLSSKELPDELQLVGRRIESLHSEIASASAKATHLENSLKHEVQKQTKAVSQQLHAVNRDADTDALTGLLNRRAFERSLPQVFETQRNAGASFAVMVIDVNHFKNFNDTHGHQAGDELLATIAQVIKANTRRGDEHAFRYGGDEFILLLPGTNAGDAVALGERLHAMLKQQVRTLPATDPPVSISAGVAEMQKHRPGDAAQLMKMADAAMYYTKRKQVACMAIDVVVGERRKGVKLPPRVSRR